MTSMDLAVSEDLRAVLRDSLQIGDRARSLQANSPLLGALPELDSLAVVTVITAIEDRFDVRIGDDEISADIFATFGDLCDFVAGKTSA